MLKYLQMNNEELLKTFLKLNLQASMSGKYTEDSLAAIHAIREEILKRMS